MQIDKKTIKTLVLGLMSCILLYWFLNDMERVKTIAAGFFGLLQPFLVGACLAFILNVPMRAIERQIRRIPKFPADRAVSILLTLVCIGLVLTVVIWLLVPQVRETAQIIAEQLPPFIGKVEQNLLKFLDENPQVAQWLHEYTDMENFDWKSMVDQAIEFVSSGLGTVLGGTVGVVRGFISSVWSVFVSMVFSLYCLGNKEQLARQGRRILYSFLPERWADEVIRIGRLSNSTFSNFFSGGFLCPFSMSLRYAGDIPTFSAKLLIVIPRLMVWRLPSVIPTRPRSFGAHWAAASCASNSFLAA